MTNHDEQIFAEEQQNKLSRRRFFEETFAAALASAGIYELIETFVDTPDRTAFADNPANPYAQEQYIINGLRVIMDNGSGVNSSNGTIPVIVHPLHAHVITATLTVPANAKSLQEAQQHLETVLEGVEKQYGPAPAGVSISVAWGLPYFQNYIPSLGKASSFFPAGTRYPAYLPIDLDTSKREGHTVYAVQEAMTFPSDQPPAGFGPVHLEQNHVSILLRGDTIAKLLGATTTIFGTGSNQAGSMFKVTSIRRGFTGGGFYGKQSLPSKMALAANIPGAKSVPTHAEVLMGFTTTVEANLAPGIIANLETIPGETNQWPNGYFKQGTTMALSHLFEDLATWYGQGDKGQNFPSYAVRLRNMLRPGLTGSPGTLTFNPPSQLDPSEVVQDVKTYHAYGHSGSMQPIVRQATPTTTNYGTTYPANIAVSTRGDFNTLDNPFYYTSDPVGDRYSSKKAAGLHFLIFQPTIGNFNRTRLAMDGHYPDGTVLSISPRSVGAAINSVLFTTHRQNYLVPPRRHRSFPLTELLT